MKIIILIWVLASCFSAQAKILNHPHNIIKSYWPESNQIFDSSLIVLANQSKSIEKKYKIKLKEVVYKKYIVKGLEDTTLGHALLVTDRVRTKSMSLLLLINNSFELEAVEVVSFAEPIEYKPSKKWLEKNYSKKKLDLFVNHQQTPNISGATLSAYSVAKTAKSIAAIWKELHN